MVRASCTMVRQELSLLVLSVLLLSSVVVAMRNDPLLTFQQELMAQQQQLARQQQQVQQQQTQQAPTISFPLTDMGPTKDAPPSYSIPLPPSQSGAPVFSETQATVQTQDSVTDQLLKAFLQPQTNGQQHDKADTHSRIRTHPRRHTRRHYDHFPRFKSRRGHDHYWVPHSHYERYYSHPRFREKFYPKSHHHIEEHEDEHAHKKEGEKKAPVVPISSEPKLEYADALAGKPPAFVEVRESGYKTGVESDQQAGWGPPLNQPSSSPSLLQITPPSNLQQGINLPPIQPAVAQAVPPITTAAFLQQSASVTQGSRAADPTPMPFYAPTPPPPLAANQVPATPGSLNESPFVPTASTSAMISALSGQEQAQNPAAFLLNPNAGAPPRFAQETFPFSGTFLQIDEQDMTREEIKDYIHPRLHLLAVHPDRHTYNSPLLDEHLEPFPLLEETKATK